MVLRSRVSFTPRTWAAWRACAALLVVGSYLSVTSAVQAAPVAPATSGAVPGASSPSPSREGDVVDVLFERLNRGDYEAVQSAIESQPATAKTLLLAGWLAMEQGRYADAERSAAQVHRSDSLHARAELLRGQALRAQGKLHEAEHAWRAGLRHAKTHAAESYVAHVLLGRLLSDQGEQNQAQRHFRVLVDAYNSGLVASDQGETLAYVAMAARALGAFHDANEAFAESIAARPGHVRTLLEWTDLFIEKDDRAQALETIEVALKYNSRSPRARATLARIKIESPLGFTTAATELDAALSINPNLVLAHTTRAAMALRDMDLVAADEHLNRALAIDPTDLEALSMRVAVRFLADDTAGQARAEAAVLRLNPHFSRMYSIVSRYAEWEHRYEDLIRLARRALSIDKEDAEAHATLAINLLRTGDEEAGRKALDEAWQRDHFNARVFHLMNLYDQVIDPSYVTFNSTHFIFRVHKDERKVLAPYLPKFMELAYAALEKHYGISPPAPIRIELYATEEDFSVRTTGMPNVGVQGVCFGRVITAVSPEAGPFNWGQILWHELSHVFHLQLSHNRVPRWFTEGLAEYETTQARPEWQREEDRALYVAFARGDVPPLSGLTRAFTLAQDPDALTAAYHTAMLAVRYVIDQYGMERVIAMLKAWGQGLSTEQVFTEALGVPIATVDGGFRDYLRTRFDHFAREFHVNIPSPEAIDGLRARRGQEPRNADVRAQLALALISAGKYARAKRAVRAALFLDPKHAVAHFALSRIALEDGDLKLAESSLQAIVDAGKDSPLLRRMLAHAAKANGSLERARKHADAAVALDPDDLEAQRLRLSLAIDDKDRDTVVNALREIAKLDQHDRAAYRMLLAVLARDHDVAGILQVGEAAIYVDPASPDIHLHLANGYAQADRLKQALAEYDQALVLGPKRPGRVHFGRALVLARLGRHKEGQAALAAAFAAEPRLKAWLEQAPELQGDPAGE